MDHITNWNCKGKLMLTAQCIFCGMFTVVCFKIVPFSFAMSICPSLLAWNNSRTMKWIAWNLILGSSTKICHHMPLFCYKWRAVTGCLTWRPTCLSAIWKIMCEIFILLHPLCSLCRICLKYFLCSTYSMRFIFSSQKWNLWLHRW